LQRQLRAKMAYHGLTVKDLAEIAGMSTTSLSEKINGKKKWWLDEVVTITNFFRSQGDDITPVELFELDLKVYCTA
jgi:antitoxin component HigA of HigAB toxin-antitoxin module